MKEKSDYETRGRKMKCLNCGNQLETEKVVLCRFCDIYTFVVWTTI